jgi:hypothetical protein
MKLSDSMGLSPACKEWPQGLCSRRPRHSSHDCPAGIDLGVLMPVTIQFSCGGEDLVDYPWLHVTPLLSPPPPDLSQGCCSPGLHLQTPSIQVPRPLQAFRQGCPYLRHSRTLG